MNVVFYLSAVIAVLATVMVITRLNIMHALLYMIVSLLAVAVVFFTLGAPFVAALEVIVYAGAIMVLFIFAIMLLNIGPQTIDQERQLLKGTGWLGPSVLALILLVEVGYVIAGRAYPAGGSIVEPQQVGIALFGPYLVGVELASFLLLASLVGARHVGQRLRPVQEAESQAVENPVNEKQNSELTADETNKVPEKQ
jgi:NADH-quinone oxidoreductase subunit J